MCETITRYSSYVINRRCPLHLFVVFFTLRLDAPPGGALHSACDCCRKSVPVQIPRAVCQPPYPVVTLSGEILILSGTRHYVGDLCFYLSSTFQKNVRGTFVRILPFCIQGVIRNQFSCATSGQHSSETLSCISSLICYSTHRPRMKVCSWWFRRPSPADKNTWPSESAPRCGSYYSIGELRLLHTCPPLVRKRKKQTTNCILSASPWGSDGFLRSTELHAVRIFVAKHQCHFEVLVLHSGISILGFFTLYC